MRTTSPLADASGGRAMIARWRAKLGAVNLSLPMKQTVRALFRRAGGALLRLVLGVSVPLEG